MQTYGSCSTIGSSNNWRVSRVELFHFRYRDARTGRWTLARYRAERREIAARYAEYEVIGVPEVRDVDPDDTRFTPHAPSQYSVDTPAEAPARARGATSLPATIDVPATVDPVSLSRVERFLLLLFLRRYVTYCARRRKYAAMNGAAALHVAVASTGS